MAEAILMNDPEIEPRIDAEAVARSIGEFLKAAREKSGLGSVDQIAREICVRPHQLEALEAGQFDRLPGAAYVLGFVRSYAGQLGVCADALIDRYKTATAQTRMLPELRFPEPIEGRRLPRWLVAVVAGVMLTGTYGIWLGLGGDATSRASAGTPESLVASAAPTEASQKMASASVTADPVTVGGQGAAAANIIPTSMTAAAAAVSSPAPSPVKVKSATLMKVSYRRLVSSTSDGAANIAVDSAFQPGDESQAPKFQEIDLTSGAAVALDFIANGVQMTPVAPGDAARNGLTLDFTGPNPQAAAFSR